MKEYTKKKMSAWLPPTPCTPEMRNNLIEVAKREGKSIADVQRSAFSLFLSTDVSETNASESLTINEEQAS